MRLVRFVTNAGRLIGVNPDAVSVIAEFHGTTRIVFTTTQEDVVESFDYVEKALTGKTKSLKAPLAKDSQTP